MRNSTGLVVSKTVLREASIESGTTLDLIVENGGTVSISVGSMPRAGWAEAAAVIANEPDGLSGWRDLPNEADAGIVW